MKKPEFVLPQAAPSQETEPKPKQDSAYSAGESAELGRIKSIINGDFFHHVPTDVTQESDKESPATIITEAKALIAGIRSEKRDQQEFFAYQNAHFDQPHYAFLKESYPGLNVNGWRVLLAVLDPLQYGTAIARKEFQIRGTISQRSAKN